jgi:hypothetical protein
MPPCSWAYLRGDLALPLAVRGGDLLSIDGALAARLRPIGAGVSLPVAVRP